MKDGFLLGLFEVEVKEFYLIFMMSFLFFMVVVVVVYIFVWMWCFWLFGLGGYKMMVLDSVQYVVSVVFLYLIQREVIMW